MGIEFWETVVGTEFFEWQLLQSVHDSLSLSQLLNHQVQAIRGGSHLLKRRPPFSRPV